MALATHAQARRDRLIPLVAIGVLAAVSAVILSRVFVGSEAAIRLLVAAIASVGLAAVMQRRNVWASAGVSVAGLAVLIGPLVFPATTFAGLPTGRTLRAILTALGQVGVQASTQVAPTAATAPLLLVAFTGVWAVGFSAHALFTRARTPLLCVIPSLAVFAFTEVVLGPGQGTLVAVLLLVSILGVLLADRLLAVRSVALDLATAKGHSQRPERAMGAAATRLGAAVLTSALLVPLILPVGPHGPGGIIPDPGTTVDPLVSIQAQLTQKDPTNLFRVESSRPAYWRMVALDEFDGVSWAQSPSSDSQTTTGLAATLLPTSDGGAPTSDTLIQRFEILGLRSPWLPAAYRPERVAYADSPLNYNVDLTTLGADGPVEEGTRYSVASSVPVASAEELDAARNITLNHSLMPTPDYLRYTQLPVDMPREVASLAHRITDGEPNPYRKMIALQDYLRTKFTYDEHLQIPSGVNPITYFLEIAKRGFCQQFAGTMAAMARSLGYPARVAIGFLPGTPEAGTDIWTVTTRQAHAWPEIWFPGYGWLAFEPTPNRENPGAMSYMNPNPYRDGSLNIGVGRGAARDLKNPPAARPLRHDANFGSNAQAVPAPPASIGRLGPVLAIALAILLLAAIAIPLVNALRRKRRLRSGQDPSSLVLATYDVFEERAGNLGFGRARGETLREYTVRLQDRGAEPATTELERLAASAEKAAYAEITLGPNEAAGVTRDAARSLDVLRKEAGFSRRIGAAYRLRPAPAAPRPSRRP